MSTRPCNKRPSLTRAETIDSCNSEDLVTVLEVHERKPYKIMDRCRENKKGVMAESLDELIERGKEKLNYPMEKLVYVVLEEDGTEVDEEEYFQTLPENTLLMLLYVGDKWSPYGLPFKMPLPLSSSKKSSKPITLAASKGMHGPNSRSESLEEVDSSPSCSAYSPSPTLMFDLASLLERLYSDPGYMALLSGKELELLAEMDLTDINDGSDIKNEMKKYDKKFLHQIQEAADRHLVEKNEIRDALGLLKIYHNAHTASSTSDYLPVTSSSNGLSNSSKNNGNENSTNAQRSRKNMIPSKSDTNNLSKLEPQPEASPNKRRRDGDKN